MRDFIDYSLKYADLYLMNEGDYSVNPTARPSVPRRHSVNCYFCGSEFDERDGSNADSYNGDDGGSICPACQRLYDEGQPKPLNFD